MNSDCSLIVYHQYTRPHLLGLGVQGLGEP